MSGADGRRPRSRKAEALAFKVGSLLLLAAGIGGSADAYTERTGNFWTNDLVLASIGLALVSMACFIKAFWASSLRPGRSQRFPDVTVEMKGVRCHTEPGGTVIGEFHVLFTNNRPLHKVALIATYRGAMRTERSDGLLDTAHAASDPALGVPGRATPMPLEILGLQRQPAILVFEMSRYGASRAADPVGARIEIEECITGRRVSIPYPADQVTPLNLDELPLVEGESTDASDA